MNEPEQHNQLLRGLSTSYRDLSTPHKCTMAYIESRLTAQELLLKVCDLLIDDIRSSTCIKCILRLFVSFLT